DRAGDAPQELLKSYSDLVAWGQQTQVLTNQEARQLLNEAEKRPAETSGVLQRAIVLRVALFRIFEAVARGSLPPEEDLALLNAELTEAMGHTYVVSRAGGFTWDWVCEKDSFERVLWPVVRSAAD